MAAHHLRVAASLEPGARPGPPVRFPARASFAIATLMAIAALGGILSPSTYAQESASWAAQGIGQDWVSLLAAVPALVIAAALTLRGSRRAPLLLGGALLYTAYSFVLYAFAVHFNWLFLVYCAVLGLSVFALAYLVAGLVAGAAVSAPRDRLPVRTTAGTLFAISGVFGLLWLSEILPALARGGAPAALAEAGLTTNPVHVLDLSLLLPALAVAGASLLRGERLGLVLAPIALGFSVLMALAIGGMILVMRLRGLAVDLAPSAAMGVIAAGCAGVLIAYLRRWR